MASVTSDACIFSAALAILQDPDPQAKAAETHRIAELWQQRRLSTAVKNASHVDRPGRDDLKVSLVLSSSPAVWNNRLQLLLTNNHFGTAVGQSSRTRLHAQNWKGW